MLQKQGINLNQKVRTLRVFPAAVQNGDVRTRYRRGHLQAGGGWIACALGRHGVSYRKREGDGRTPAGAYKILRGLFRADRLARPASAIRFQHITPLMGWCDDPRATAYNRPVKLPYSPSHEVMLREDRLYDVVLVLDYNIAPRRRNAGSAIFFHIAEAGWPGTAGCIAISPADMRRLLPRLSRTARVNIF